MSEQMSEERTEDLTRRLVRMLDAFDARPEAVRLRERSYELLAEAVGMI